MKTLKNISNILLTMLLTLAGNLAMAAASITAGSGLDLITSTSTGIYQMNKITNEVGQRRETLALVRDGKVIELHTRTALQKAYLRRGTNSTPVKKSTETFDRLIQIAGGINRDIDAIGGSKKTEFYNVAGFSGTGGTGGSVPSQPMPGKGGCGFGYEFSKQLNRCVPISSLWPRVKEILTATVDGTSIIGSAHAAYWELSFKLKKVVDLAAYSFSFSDNVGGAGVSGFRLQGFGFDILWLDMPGG